MVNHVDEKNRKVLHYFYRPDLLAGAVSPRAPRGRVVDPEGLVETHRHVVVHVGVVAVPTRAAVTPRNSPGLLKLLLVATMAEPSEITR